MSDAMTRAWLGYARKNGKKGIRNRVLVVYTVKCAEHVARQIVAEARDGNVELVGSTAARTTSTPSTSSSA